MSVRRGKRLARVGLIVAIVSLALLVPSMWLSATFVGGHACFGLQAGYVECSWEDQPVRPKRWLRPLNNPPRMVWLPKLLLMEDGVAEVTVPLWVPAAAGAALVALGRLTCRRSRACPSCGYDRSGSPSTKCPECGFQRA